MIHSFKLPSVTYSRLRDIVRLQMDFLYYATLYAEFDAVSHLLKKSCIMYFASKNMLHNEFQWRGEDIAKWLWSGSQRLEKLEAFALACRDAPKEQEIICKWCHRLNQAVEELLDPVNRIIHIQRFFDVDLPVSKNQENKNPRWQQCASNFLLYFYDEYLGKSGIEKNRLTFDETLFTEPGAGKYGRQDFLSAFFSCNGDLEMCPFCDEMRIYTHSTTGIYADIDHFLPKNRYPHLACHPYNLVPTCHACNSGNKNQHDPLRGFEDQPRSRILFPYSQTSLSQNAYVDVTVSWPSREIPPLIDIHKLIPRPSSKEFQQDLQAGIDLLIKLYNIPGRWKIPRNWEELTESKTLVISETLFRRMHQFLGNSPEAFLGSDSTQKVYNALKQLLYYLDQDDRGKDPFAFVMTWILAALLKKEIQPALGKKEDQLPASVREIVSWFGQSLKENAMRDGRVEELLSFLPLEGSEV